MSAFNRTESLHRKTVGMSLAAGNRAADLAFARQVAMYLAERDPDRECDTDMVGKELERLGYSGNLGPAAGSIFRESKWTFVGRVNSERVTNHAREIKRWHLNESSRATMRPLAELHFRTLIIVRPSAFY